MAENEPTANAGEQTFSQAEVNAFLAAEKRKWRKANPNADDNPMVVELKAQVEELTEALTASKKSNELMTTKNKALEAVAKEKDDLTAKQRADLQRFRAENIINQAAGKYRFISPEVQKLLTRQMLLDAKLEEKDGGALNVAIGDKAVDAYLEEYVTANPQLVATSVLPGAGATGSTTSFTTPVLPNGGMPITHESIAAAQANGTLGQLLDTPERAQEARKIMGIGGDSRSSPI